MSSFFLKLSRLFAKKKMPASLSPQQIFEQRLAKALTVESVKLKDAAMPNQTAAALLAIWPHQSKPAALLAANKEKRQAFLQIKTALERLLNQEHLELSSPICKEDSSWNNAEFVNGFAIGLEPKEIIVNNKQTDLILLVSPFIYGSKPADQSGGAQKTDTVDVRLDRNFLWNALFLSSCLRRSIKSLRCRFYSWQSGASALNANLNYKIIVNSRSFSYFYYLKARGPLEETELWQKSLKLLLAESLAYTQYLFNANSQYKAASRQEAQSAGLIGTGILELGRAKQAQFEVVIPYSEAKTVLKILLGAEDLKTAAGKPLLALLFTANANLFAKDAALADALYMHGSLNALSAEFSAFNAKIPFTFGSALAAMENEEDVKIIVQNYLAGRIGVSQAAALFSFSGFAQNSAGQRAKAFFKDQSFNEARILQFWPQAALDLWNRPSPQSFSDWLQANQRALEDLARQAAKSGLALSKSATALLQKTVLNPLNQIRSQDYRQLWEDSIAKQWPALNEQSKRRAADRLSNRAWAEILAPQPDGLNLIKPYISKARRQNLIDEIVFIASVRGIDWQQSALILKELKL